MTLREFQQLIRDMYHDKDAARGVEGTFMWLTEEIGELATALRSGSQEEQALEFADVLAWLVTIANVAEIDLEQAVAKKIWAGLSWLWTNIVYLPGCGEAMMYMRPAFVPLLLFLTVPAVVKSVN